MLRRFFPSPKFSLEPFRFRWFSYSGATFPLCQGAEEALVDSTDGLRNTGSCGRAVAGLRMVWNAIIDPPVPGGFAQAAHRHCTRPFPSW